MIQMKDTFLINTVVINSWEEILFNNEKEVLQNLSFDFYLSINRILRYTCKHCHIGLYLAENKYDHSYESSLVSLISS